MIQFGPCICRKKGAGKMEIDGDMSPEEEEAVGVLRTMSSGFVAFA